jgi:predicted Fe-Mo cluster-binding NifX family protein
MEAKMLVAVSSLGNSLDAWAGIPFGTCSQFLVVDTDTMEFVVLSIPPEHQDPTKVSLYAIRAIAKFGAQVVITGVIKRVCKETMQSLGMEVIDKVGRMTVRQALELYTTGGPEAIVAYQPPAEKIAVASHGATLDAQVAAEDEPCTSFVLVDPETKHCEVVDVELAETVVQASVNAVRAAARAGATVVITPGTRPECCLALRSLAITVIVASPGITVREAVEKYQRGELPHAPYL